MADQRSSKSADVEHIHDAAATDPRPITASDKKPPSRSRKSRSKAPTATDSEQQPLEIDGWGDFDSDRLLRDDAAPPINYTRRPPLAEPSVTAGDAEGEEDNESQRLTGQAADRRASARLPLNEPPLKQVLRQRTLIAMELEPPPLVESSPSHAAQRKSLVAHRRVVKLADEDHLPRLNKSGLSSVAAASPRTSSGGLFGPSIEDSAAMRTRLFAHLAPLWALMTASSVADARSPFECSMVLMKICKTIGIALSSSPAPDVWLSSSSSSSSGGAATRKAAGKSSKSYVDVATFTEFVVRNAIQPAMHHFHLDRDVDEYTHTLDAIVDSLVTPVAEEEEEAEGGGDQQKPPLQLRMRELSEIQAVLPRWKKGIQSVQKQNPLVKNSSHVDGGGSEKDHDNEDDGQSVTLALPLAAAASSSAMNRAKRLPASEARALQDANIRRKVQLRKSWQPRVRLNGEANEPEIDSDRGDALGSCMRVETMAAAVDSSSPPALATDDHEQVGDSPGSNQEQPPQDEELPRLLCGACTRDEDATLWCSSCFAVFCYSCWVETHHSTVDMTAVDNQREAPAPTARPLATQRGDAPPVAMVYLPTKPLAVGKRIRGAGLLHGHVPHVSTDDDYEGLQAAVSSHSILPALRPLPERRGLVNHTRSMPVLEGVPPQKGSMDSTANLLKALMLGTASSASVLGSTLSPAASSSSPSTTGSKGAKDPSSSVSRRHHLTPAAITLDIDSLLPR